MKTYEERMQCVQQKLQYKKTKHKVLMATAGTLCLCFIAGIAFWPFGDKEPNINQYKDHKYFKVIEAINRDFPKREENLFEEFEGIFRDDVVFDVGMDMVVPEGDMMAPGASADESVNGAIEITDNQVAGVLEADIIKRSQTHIFYLNGNALEVYPIAGMETELQNRWYLSIEENVYYYNAEMYLSADATRINLITSGFGAVFQADKKSAFVQVISLDVSNPMDIQQKNCFYISGSLLSSRMVGDQMLIMSQYRMNTKIDFEDESTFLPQYGEPENMQSVPAENIIVPGKLSDKTYTVVTLLDGQNMTVLDSGAFMSYSTELYVSAERIYATRTYTDTQDIMEGMTENKTMTEISCMNYGADGLKSSGTFCVEGSVKNQYSMDEYAGVFRVVTATNKRVVVTSPEISTAGGRLQNANLYCFKVDTWEQLACVDRFAPDGETVESVRFDGDYAYVCTAVVVTLTDPVFFFDMTDISNIIVKDTGKIDGYSSSLIQLNDGYLMGIGYNDKRNLKVEIYEETENGVESVCEYIKVDRFAIDYKAYYIDRENNLFGIPTVNGYVLLQFDGYQLTLLAEAKTSQGYSISELDHFRGVVIDKCLYVFGPLYFKVMQVG